jgi:hypothetical protein
MPARPDAQRRVGAGLFETVVEHRRRFDQVGVIVVADGEVEGRLLLDRP